MMCDSSGVKQIGAGNTAICLLSCLFVLLTVDSVRAVPAFPGAEGYGASSVGGRGGAVYEVTNLNATGTGSLGAAIGASGARTVVFRVSGTIVGSFKISNGNITIAGQTAPGDGICIKGNLSISANDVIIRYIRVRPNATGDAIGGGGTRIILDHVSASWSSDEVVSIYHCANITIQWCMITEACTDPGNDHNFGGIWGNNPSTYHHNLWAHHKSRIPRWTTDPGANDYRNNVIYNWRSGNCYGSEGSSNINMIGNYYKSGPATDSGVLDRIAEPGGGSWWVSGNYVFGFPSVTTNNWLGMDGTSYTKLSAPWPSMPITCEQSAQDAYTSVLASAGCSKPNRDSVDTRIIQEVSTGTATYGINGIVNNPSEVGGWPTLASGTPPVDNDHDGMADNWETARGLSPTSAADRNYYTLSTDYTNLEVYLDSLVNVSDETSPTPDPMTWATEPYGANSTSITMVATTADDISGVEYFFDCTSGGGHDSAWQDSTTYTDTGLTLGATYSYQVKARDKSISNNETGFSGTASASPTTDNIAPMPNPMTWASAPAATGIDTIAMTATTATDASGVEYYFACTAGGGHDSGWQDSASYTDTGLTNNTTYAYTVVARDKSAAQNVTSASDEAGATTLLYECTSTPAIDFNADCQVNFMDYAAIAGTWGEAPGVLVDLITNGGFDTDLSGWSASIANPTQVQITWDAGTAKLARTVSDSTAPNGNYLYQVIPVVDGKQYQIAAQWKGNLTGTDRQWAEVFVGFVATGTSTGMGEIMYKKATYGGPNATPMPWDWESILLSPNTNPVPPAGGLFTATNNYMVVAFNLGGRANAGTTYYNVDNVSVVGGTPCPSMDLNDDCAFDWLDIEKFVADWLDCNRNPGSECWQ
jgi:hypothetical protein